MKNAISWFEIPCSNLERGQKFYETILNVQLIPMDVAELQMRVFPVDEMDEDHVSGALVFNEEFYSPSHDGVLIYLNGGAELQIILDKVDKAGGSILVPKTEISPDHGFMAIISDTEGNRIGFHSNG